MTSINHKAWLWTQKTVGSIPWLFIEDKYTALRKSDRSNITKPVRMVLGALTIQIEFQYSDAEPINQIHENPFDASLMVHFRKTSLFRDSDIVFSWMLSIWGYIQ